MNVIMPSDQPNSGEITFYEDLLKACQILLVAEHLVADFLLALHAL